MIWNQWQGSQDFWANCANGIGSCPSGGNAQAVTLGGVPYHFFDNSGELMFFRDTEVSSGSVDILAAFNWLVAHPSADPPLHRYREQSPGRAGGLQQRAY